MSSVKVVYLRELAVERRNNLADGLGGPSGRGDDVGRSATASTPVLGRGPVDTSREISGSGNIQQRIYSRLLGGGGGMNGGHQTLDDTELVVNDLGERSKAIGRAGGVGDLIIVVHAAFGLERSRGLTTSCFLGSYASRLTPQTNMGASLEGAEMMTFLAPPDLMCTSALVICETTLELVD